MRRPINKRALLRAIGRSSDAVSQPADGHAHRPKRIGESSDGGLDLVGRDRRLVGQRFAATVSPVNTVALKSSSLVGPINQVGINPFFSKGTAWLDPSGTVYVQGTDSTNDTVTISIDTKGTASTADDMVKVDISNAGLPLTYEFALASVNHLNVQTYGGDDYVDNQTSITMFADGGAGTT